MAVHLIPREAWVQFLNDFSREHQGKSAAIEIVRGNAQTDIVAQNLPLVGVSADQKAGEDIITITIGAEAHNSVTRIIDDVLRVAVDQPRAGITPSLRIESMSEATTLLTLR